MSYDASKHGLAELARYEHARRKLLAAKNLRARARLYSADNLWAQEQYKLANKLERDAKQLQNYKN